MLQLFKFEIDTFAGFILAFAFAGIFLPCAGFANEFKTIGNRQFQ